MDNARSTEKCLFLAGIPNVLVMSAFRCEADIEWLISLR